MPLIDVVEFQKSKRVLQFATCLVDAYVQLSNAGKPGRFSSFNDQVLSDGRIVIDLIDACRPGVIKYDLVKDAFTEEVRNDDVQLFTRFPLICAVSTECGRNIKYF